MADTTQAIEIKTKADIKTIQRTAITVATGETLYQGQIVCLDASGEAVNASTSLQVGGILREADAAAGDSVTLEYGFLMKFPLSGVAATDIGSTAYAADNQTATTSSNTAVLGEIVSIETGYAWIYLTLETKE